MDVNTNTQVLNVFGEVIPRLYAVGNMVGGFKGKVNAGCGQALGWTYQWRHPADRRHERTCTTCSESLPWPRQPKAAGCGQALGWTYTSGRIAGQHVVTLEPLA